MTEPIRIRRPETLAEATAAHNVLSEVFGTLPPAGEREAAAQAWLARRAGWAALFPTTTWAAFRGGECLGSYQLDERALRVGGASVPVGCVGAVATSPAHRGRGVASALMRHAEAEARRTGLGLLLLHGIGGFYHRFGYANVADAHSHRIAPADALALPPAACAVRPAALEDSGALLALYERHQGRMARTPALQLALLRIRLPARPPLLAVGAGGEPLGYLLESEERGQLRADEVGADTWDAAAALLQHQARRAAGPITWAVSPRSHTYFLLADRVPLESVTVSVPDSEWMARAASLTALFAALLPAWQAHAEAHPPALRWEVGGEPIVVRRDGGALALGGEAPGAPAIRMTQEAFVRVLLGNRPPAWAARQPGQHIPADLLPLLGRLVADHFLFFPRTDEF